MKRDSSRFPFRFLGTWPTTLVVFNALMFAIFHEALFILSLFILSLSEVNGGNNCRRFAPIVEVISISPRVTKQ